MSTGHLKSCLNITFVAGTLADIDAEMSELIGLAWSANTLATRNSQWRKYIEFCSSMSLQPVPAEPLTVARYLVKLSSSCKYNTINNYLSAICVLHRYYGYPAEFRDFFLIKMVLSGIKSRYGAAVTPKVSLSLNQLRLMYSLLPNTELNEILWTVLIFSFRTLLRKSNIVPCPNTTHTLRRSDICLHRRVWLFLWDRPRT